MTHQPEPLVFGRLKGKEGEPFVFTRTCTMSELISACCPVDRVYYQYPGIDGSPIVREAGHLSLDFVPSAASSTPPSNFFQAPEGLTIEPASPGVTISNHQIAYSTSFSPKLLASTAPISADPSPPPSPGVESSPQLNTEPHSGEPHPRNRFLSRLRAKRALKTPPDQVA